MITMRKRFFVSAFLTILWGTLGLATQSKAQLAYADNEFVDLVAQHLRAMGYQADVKECFTMHKDYTNCTSETNNWYLRLYTDPIRFCVFKSSSQQWRESGFVGGFDGQGRNLSFARCN